MDLPVPKYIGIPSQALSYRRAYHHPPPPGRSAPSDIIPERDGLFNQTKSNHMSQRQETWRLSSELQSRRLVVALHFYFFWDVVSRLVRLHHYRCRVVPVVHHNPAGRGRNDKKVAIDILRVRHGARSHQSDNPILDLSRYLTTYFTTIHRLACSSATRLSLLAIPRLTAP
ncbi:hypothetical protein LZ30DRAFT_142565 [Colletotrichum cereale]|nr:hypothetical protein LZ30DRAFT_142565 [Colletotrichum cereale]